MRAWVSRRRGDGSLLEEAIPMVEGARPCQLMIVNVTDYTSRRPIKLARILPIGEQRILAEIAKPKLVWLKERSFILSGIEVLKETKREVHQTWLCNLVAPDFAKGFRVADVYQSGVARPRSAIRDLGSSTGFLTVSSHFERALNRHTLTAELAGYETAIYGPKRLIDCDIEFMSEERFELSGLYVNPPFETRPEQILRDAWLCEFHIELPDLTRMEYRMLKPTTH